jgi:hypothetical protein
MKVGDFTPTFQSIDRLLADIQTGQESALEWYGKTATDQMKEQHDRDAHAIQRYVNRTYYLSTSIGYDVARVSDGMWRVRMFAPPFYAEAVEYGTPKSAAYPFFWVEVYGFQDAAVSRLMSEFFGALARHEARVR